MTPYLSGFAAVLVGALFGHEGFAAALFLSAAMGYCGGRLADVETTSERREAGADFLRGVTGVGIALALYVVARRITG